MTPAPSPSRNPFSRAVAEYLAPFSHAEKVARAREHVVAMRANVAHVERTSPADAKPFRTALEAAEKAFRSLLH